LPPVSHMMATIRNASPARSQDCTFLGKDPAASALFPGCLRADSCRVPQFAASTAREGQFFLADGEITGVDDFGSDVHAVLDLKANQVRLAVLHFVESRFFPGGALDVGERVVVIDRGQLEGFTRSFWLEDVVELNFRA
jgi:hypothetical protein